LAEIQRDADIGQVEGLDFRDRARQPVGDRDIHRSRKRKSHVASVDDHDDAGIGGRGDERHAQFSVAEEKRREAISPIVPQDARGEPRPDLERPRLAGSRAVCHQRSGSEICANLVSGRALHACSDAS